MASQVLYAVTGIVLARELSQEDFGLVGVLLVFQAFASLFVDSGFSYALIRHKQPSKLDYSTVLWFNIAVAAAVYLILFACAPLIAAFFQGDQRLIPLSRVMFIALIINAAAIVQTNRLMKAMDVRMVAVSNSLGLIAGGVVGIVLAVKGFGAWAIVWQTLTLAAVKTGVLWLSTRWKPLWRFSLRALATYFGIGSKMMFSSFLNTLFLNIYGFLIGHSVSMSSLGYYTQSDKWSKMGISSLSQVLTSSFVPPLAAVQDDRQRFRAMVSKINRFTAYLLFPALLGLIAVAEPLFHTLFGAKWDPSIILFQILLLRGVFAVFNSLYSNYMLVLNHGTAIVRLEILRDGVAVVALVLTFPYMALTLPADPVYGLRILLWGQFAATFLTWIVSLIVTVRLTGLSAASFLRDNMPYLAQTLLIVPIMLWVGSWVEAPWLKLTVELAVALALYVGGNAVFGSKIQRDVFAYFRKGL